MITQVKDVQKIYVIYREKYRDRVPNKQFLMIGLYLLIEIESGYAKSHRDRGQPDDDVSECAKSGVARVRNCKRLRADNIV